MFILGDMMLFGIFFVVFAYYYAMEPAMFLASQAKLNQNYGAINTVILLSSSWFVVLAVHAVRQGRAKWAGRLFLLASLCGLSFGAIKVLEYSEKIAAGITITTNDFFMYYYVYTGLHFVHVTIGMVVLFYLWRKTRQRSFSQEDVRLFETGGVYWHMVDLLWIVLFPLLYLIR